MYTNTKEFFRDGKHGFTDMDNTEDGDLAVLFKRNANTEWIDIEWSITVTFGTKLWLMSGALVISVVVIAFFQGDGLSAKNCLR